MLGESNLLNLHLTSWRTVGYVTWWWSHVGSAIAVDTVSWVASLRISMWPGGGICVGRHDRARQVQGDRVIKSAQSGVNRLNCCLSAFTAITSRSRTGRRRSCPSGPAIDHSRHVAPQAPFADKVPIWMSICRE